MSDAFLPRRRCIDRRAFTLIELLVVVAIIAVLVAMLLPVLAQARDRARRVLCLTNQRQTFSALSLYADDNAEYVPYNNPKTLSGPGNYHSIPYTWDDVQLVRNIQRYGFLTNFLICPSQNDPIYDMNQVPGKIVTVAGNTHYLDYVGNTLYWPGTTQQAEFSTDLSKGIWYDTLPSVATTRIGLDGSKIVLTDMNMYASSGFATINHHRSRGTWFLGAATSLVEVTSQIEGSNRMYADGHGTWVTPKEMGKNSTRIATSLTLARYSHAIDGSRPYWF